MEGACVSKPFRHCESSFQKVPEVPARSRGVGTFNPKNLKGNKAKFQSSSYFGELRAENTGEGVCAGASRKHPLSYTFL